MGQPVKPFGWLARACLFRGAESDVSADPLKPVAFGRIRAFTPQAEAAFAAHNAFGLWFEFD